MRNNKRNNKGVNGQIQGHKARSITYEEYIEVIYGLQQKHGHVHTNDLALELGVAPPSVTEMVQKLADKKFVNYTPYRGVTLTKEGEKSAKESGWIRKMPNQMPVKSSIMYLVPQ
jgi:Mn-dependent DtxR family transcriptional regulator